MSSHQSPQATNLTLRQVLRHALISAGPSLAAYYGTRSCGAPELQALITATIVSGLQALYKVVRNRRFDVISSFLVLNFGLSLAIAIVTEDARMAQVSNTIPGIVLSLFFMGSALIGQPLTELVLAKVQPGRVEELMVKADWTDGDVRAYHRMHIRVSFWCGAISLLLSAISIVIIYSFSVDTAQVVNQVFSLATTIGLIVGIIMVIGGYPLRLAARQTSTLSSAMVDSPEM